MLLLQNLLNATTDLPIKELVKPSQKQGAARLVGKIPVWTTLSYFSFGASNMATSGIDFTKTFSAASAPKAASDKPKAQFWLNIGYESEVIDEDGTPRFVSLPSGIALDTQDYVEAKSRNADFQNFQNSRNDLLDQIMAHAAKLAAGEACILNLQIQLRRVNDDVVATPSGSNPFIKQLSL